MANTPVHFYWFDDHIEIRSPGGLYGGISESDFGKPGVVGYRNPKLAEALKTMGFVERHGFGIYEARKAMEKNGNSAAGVSIGETVTVILRKLDLDALVAKAAELGCCQALFQLKRDWDSTSGKCAIHLPQVSGLPSEIGYFSAQAEDAQLDGPRTAKEIAFAALREYTRRHPVSKTNFTPQVPMARIMHLLRELFGAEESEMREKFKCSVNDEAEFRRLSEHPPSLSAMESAINREAEDERMQALISWV